MTASVAKPVVDDEGTKRRFRMPSAGKVGAIILLLIAVPSVVTLPWSLQKFDEQRVEKSFSEKGPAWPWEITSDGRIKSEVLKNSDDSIGEDGDEASGWSLYRLMGTDRLGRSLFWRILLGGAISLGIGVAAAMISVIIGVTWGSISGYVGGRTDAVMMRCVDVLFGLPYILLVILVAVMVAGLIDRMDAYVQRQIAADPNYQPFFLLETIQRNPQIINVLTLVIAIGGVSWLTMARVIRGQVLSLRNQTFIEAARAVGVRPIRIMVVHLLPNLIGPIVVYTTLTVPVAILQESFLSFLGIGVKPPVPSWGNLAADGVKQLTTFAVNQSVGAEGKAVELRWWLFFWPSLLLGLTLLALNFLGDALRTRLDPRRVQQ